MADCSRSATMPSTRNAMKDHGIAPIDLVVVNLYPFEATVAKAPVSRNASRISTLAGPR